jgi:hypothetical protein
VAVPAPGILTGDIAAGTPSPFNTRLLPVPSAETHAGPEVGKEIPHPFTIFGSMCAGSYSSLSPTRFTCTKSFRSCGGIALVAISSFGAVDFSTFF